MDKQVKMLKCPNCGQKKLHPIEARNSLSRRNNKTYICSDCGVSEALSDWVRKSMNGGVR